MKIITRAATVAAIGLGMLGFANVAHAAPAKAVTHLTMSSFPSSMMRGQKIMTTGRVWATPRGERRQVNFYFMRSIDTEFRYKTSVMSSPTGAYSRVLTANTTGTWRVSVTETSNRQAARTQRVIHVVAKTHVFKTYSGIGDMSGPIIHIPTLDYTVLWTYRCGRPYSPFIVFAWNGRPSGYESNWRSGQSGAGTWFGHDGAKSGYWTVGTQDDCSWSFTILSGTRLATV